MKGDFTRFTWDPKKHYKSVRMQQGRVQTDADWNEQVEIEEHLRETALTDVIGACGVPREGGGFGVEIAPGGADLVITDGRIYVDGILCELGGETVAIESFPANDELELAAGALEAGALAQGEWIAVFGDTTVDAPTLAEVTGISEDGRTLELAADVSAHSGSGNPRFRRVVTYRSQRDFPAAPLPPDFDPPPDPAAGIYLAYLDVWQRHVTALEDPEIREVALGGPDTATRVQTVCQVRLSRAGGLGEDITCDTALPAETAPSTGRLRARAQPDEDDEGPCVVPASAGYTRLENQLYRVEVHDGGVRGGDATFKWSRDNGTITSDWLAHDALTNKLTVASTGRDLVLGFHSARWVELTDDARELRGEPGLLVRVVGVQGDTIEIDPGGQTVDLADFGPHPKVRRWDMLDTASGAVPIELAPNNDGFWRLESGVQVRFEAGTYRSGDYWVIPARAFVGEFAGEIEWPRDTLGEPLALAPRGIEHHYCKLALVDFAGGGFVGEPIDCRPGFPPLTELDPGGGCCTVVVLPGEDIQAALDSLPDEGGCVCLKTGVHEVVEPIRIEESNVVLHGEGPGAIVRRSTGYRLLNVGTTGPEVSQILVESLRFEARPQAAAPDFLIDLNRCRRVTVRDCQIGTLSTTLVAVGIRRGHAIQVVRCDISGVENGIWANDDSRDNWVLDSRLTGAGISSETGVYGVLLDEAFGVNRVEGNHIENFSISVRVDPEAAESIIAANRIERLVALETGNLLFAIDVAAPRCVVRENVIELSGPRYGGIRGTASGITIAANRIHSSGAELEGERSTGILLGVLAIATSSPPDGAVVRHNRLTGPQDGILVAGALGFPVTGTRIQGNRLEGPGGDESSIGISLERSHQGVVESNEIRGAGLGVELEGGTGNRVLDNCILDGATGILATEEHAPEISRNQVENMRRLGFGGTELTGAAALTHCRFSHCSYEGFDATSAIGVGVLNDFGEPSELAIDSCEILDTGISRGGERVALPAVGLVGLMLFACQITRNLIKAETSSQSPEEFNSLDRALFLSGWPAAEYNLSERINLTLVLGSAQITDNRFVGPGFPELINVGFFTNVSDQFSFGFTFEKLIFAHNDVQHATSPLTLSLDFLTQLAQGGDVTQEDFDDNATIRFGLREGVIQGNQVRASILGLPTLGNFNNIPLFSFLYPSMNFTDVGHITLLGNMTTGPLINPGSIIPINHSDFNSIP